MSGTQSNWIAFKELIVTPDLPGLGPEPRDSRRSISDLTQRVDRFMEVRRLPPDLDAPLRCLALLWHDHLEASHGISQQLHTNDGSFLHGIMHRREPDYGNAKYWFHRVGGHPTHPRIADQVVRLLEHREAGDLLERLVPAGRWDPFGFVDACEKAAGPSAVSVPLLQAVQEIEFDALLSHLLTPPPRL